MRDKILLVDPIRKIVKRDEIDIMGISLFGLFNVFEETAVDPLEAIDKTHSVQSRAKRHESIQDSPARSCGPKVEDTIGEKNGVRRTIGRDRVIYIEWR